MKKLISTFTGGAPFSLDYLTFIDAKINDIVKGFGSFAPLCIISGCELSQGIATWQVSEGYVYIIGELYYVPAADTGLPNADNPQTLLYWNVTEAATAPSPNVYHDAVSHNDTLERTAYLSNAATLFTYASTLTYQKCVANSLLNGWNEVGAGGQPPFLGGFSSPGDKPLRFRTTLLNELIVEGAVVNIGTPGSGTAIVEFPASIQPSGGNRVYIIAFEGSAGFATLVLGQASGRWYLSLFYTGAYSGAAYIQIPPIPLD